MSASYFDSGDVKVFPAGRRADYVMSRTMSENNITQLIKSLRPDVGGTFIITEDFDNATDIEFCIKGYYFSIPKSVITTIAPSTGCWLSIDTETVSSGDYSGYVEIKGDSGGSGSTFLGLAYETGTQPVTFDLQLLNSDGSLNSNMMITKMLIAPAYIVSSTTPEINEFNVKKLWIDSGNDNIIKFYNGASWEACGAVYK